ncbi:MAG TPA: ankyrin repeat domain-containing protein, partial [bacterium]|nr:ankyrin repeat domain-containing protein [bacterium]
ARVLLDRGAQPERETGSGDKPLRLAIIFQHYETANFLLDRGADPLGLTHGGTENAWSVSVRDGHTPMVRRMLEMGIPPDKPVAIYGEWWPPVVVAAAQGWLPILQLLTAHGADIAVVGTGERTAWTEATHYGRVEVLRWLLEQPYDHEALQGGNFPVLHHAAEAGQVEATRLLLDAGFDPLRAGPHGTVWSEAVVNGREPIVALLLDHGTDVGTGTDWGAPVWTAARQGYAGVLRRLLQEPGAKAQLDWRHPQWGTTPVYEAVAIGNKDCVQALLEAGANPNLRREGKEPETGMTGIPPLSKAIGTRQHEVALLLLKHGADPNATAVDYAPPLYTAFYNDRMELFKALLEHGADPNTTWDWRSMLSWTAYEDRPDYGIELLKHGANPNVQNRAGQWLTPLLAAAYKGHYTLVEALIAHGADPFAIDWACHDALSVAKDGGHADVVQLLKDVVKAKESEGLKREPCALQRESDSDPESEWDREEREAEAERERERAERERQRN